MQISMTSARTLHKTIRERRKGSARVFSTTCGFSARFLLSDRRIHEARMVRCARSSSGAIASLNQVTALNAAMSFLFNAGRLWRGAIMASRHQLSGCSPVDAGLVTTLTARHNDMGNAIKTCRMQKRPRR